jgi:hypothetical protein
MANAIANAAGRPLSFRVRKLPRFWGISVILRRAGEPSAFSHQLSAGHGPKQ